MSHFPSVPDAAIPNAEALTPEHLHARYARRIDRRIRAVLGADNEHEDLVQDVLITMFQKIGTLRNPLCLDSWVSQVTMNTLRYAMRRRRLRRHASLEALSEQESPLSIPDFDARELTSRVMRVMERMPTNDCALLTRFWFSCASIEETAVEAGCSAVTIRRRLLKARGRFKKLACLDPALAQLLRELERRRLDRFGSEAPSPPRGHA